MKVGLAEQFCTAYRAAAMQALLMVAKPEFGPVLLELFASAKENQSPYFNINSSNI